MADGRHKPLRKLRIGDEIYGTERRGINDAPEQVEPLLEAAAAAGATGIGGIALHLRGEVKQILFDWLRAYRPDLVERYEQLYGRGAYAPLDERNRLAALVRRRGVRLAEPGFATAPASSGRRGGRPAACAGPVFDGGTDSVVLSSIDSASSGSPARRFQTAST